MNDAGHKMQPKTRSRVQTAWTHGRKKHVQTASSKRIFYETVLLIEKFSGRK